MVQGQQTSGACTIAQWAAVEALNGPQDLIPVRRKAFEERRDLVVSMLESGAGPEVSEPRGRVLRLPLLRGGDRPESPVGQADRDRRGFVTELLEDEGVAAVQGPLSGWAQFRVSYATSLEALEKACKSTRSFTAELR